MHFLIFLFIFMYPLNSLSDPILNEFIQTSHDFSRHVELHRKRVELLGRRLTEMFYEHIDPDSASIFLQLHDIGKTRQIDQALSQNIHYKYPMDETLFIFFGVDKTKDSDIVILVNLINSLDQDLKKAFYLKYKVPVFIQGDLERIEKIADLVDRGLDPVSRSEFGRPMKLASEFLKVDFMKEQALWLESQYDQIVSGYEYHTRSCTRISFLDHKL